jgi:riboflavin synthase
MRLSSRLGGHIVLGHVDTVGRVLSGRRQGVGAHRVSFERAFGKYVVEKGSIAVDGISLTSTRCSPRPSR